MAAIRILALMLAFTLSACMTIEMNAPLRTERLTSLTPKVSAKADVLLALGQPSGTGAVRFSETAPYRSIWFYEYIKAESGLSKSNQSVTILLVFFDGERYDGHFWFGESVGMTTERKGGLL